MRNFNKPKPGAVPKRPTSKFENGFQTASKAFFWLAIRLVRVAVWAVRRAASWYQSRSMPQAGALPAAKQSAQQVLAPARFMVAERTYSIPLEPAVGSIRLNLYDTTAQTGGIIAVQKTMYRKLLITEPNLRQYLIKRKLTVEHELMPIVMKGKSLESIKDQSVRDVQRLFDSWGVDAQGAGTLPSLEIVSDAGKAMQKHVTEQTSSLPGLQTAAVVEGEIIAMGNKVESHPGQKPYQVFSITIRQHVGGETTLRGIELERAMQVQKITQGNRVRVVPLGKQVFTRPDGSLGKRNAFDVARIS